MPHSIKRHAHYTPEIGMRVQPDNSLVQFLGERQGTITDVRRGGRTGNYHVSVAWDGDEKPRFGTYHRPDLQPAKEPAL